MTRTCCVCILAPCLQRRFHCARRDGKHVASFLNSPRMGPWTSYAKLRPKIENPKIVYTAGGGVVVVVRIRSPIVSLTCSWRKYVHD